MYVHKKGERRRCKLIIMNDIAVLASEGKRNTKRERENTKRKKRIEKNSLPDNFTFFSEKKLLNFGDDITWKFQMAFNYDTMVLLKNPAGKKRKEK